MTHRILIALVSVALVAGCGRDEADPAVDQTPPPAGPATPASPDAPAANGGAAATASDEAVEFARQAAIGNMFEIQSSQLIIEKNVGGEEKEFAETAMADHKKAHDELVTLARGKNITLPTELDEEHAEKLKKLQGLSGAELGEAYHEMQEESHKASIALFENASKNLQDAELRAYATKTLPTLKAHMAKLSEHQH